MASDSATPSRFGLTGARVFDGESFHDAAAVVIADGRVESIGPAEALPDNIPREILDGGLLAPGFVDVQVNGGGGRLLNHSPDVETIRTIAEAHRAYGTTSLLPTLISAPFETMERTVEAIRAARAEGVPGVRGVHFEGPYLNPARKGAHSADMIRSVDPGALKLFSGSGLGQVLVTLAPEKVPACYVRTLTEAGIRVSAGHSEASAVEIRGALADGLAGFTHLFNAMPPMLGRAPGIVGAALADPHSWCGLIVDGHHVDPLTLRVAIAAKPAGKTILVTDAMATVGSDSDRFELDGRTIYARDGRLVTDDGTLAGAHLDMAGAVANAIRLCGVELGEALRMASLYPAAFLGLDAAIGRIAAGYEADLVHLSDDLSVRRTWISGQG